MNKNAASAAAGMLIGLGFGLGFGLAGPAARAAELTGTAYTVLYRGPTGMAAPAAPAAVPAWPARRSPFALPAQPNPRVLPAQRPGAAGALAPTALRLVNGRSGQEVARAEFDGALGGHLFRLPLNLAPDTHAVCLVLKNAAGTSLPLRDESAGDDGYAFRNPLWEAELARVLELGELRAELGKLDAQLAAERQELGRLQAEHDAANAGAQACTAPAAAAEPPRPASALAADAAAALAGGLCALRWEATMAPVQADMGRTFVDAGLAADWQQREPARPNAAAWPALRLPMTQAELQLVADAATKGRAFLEHAEGLRTLARGQEACRGSVLASAAAALRDWEAARLAAREAPARTQRQCEQRRTRIHQLSQAHAGAPAYRSELERRTANLAAASAPANQSARLDKLACKDL